MAKKYSVTEKGSDILGRKRYEVKEESGEGSALGIILLCGLMLLLITLPSGILASAMYFFAKFINYYDHENNKKNSWRRQDKVALISSIVSVVICLFCYAKYYDMEKDGFGVLFWSAVLGLTGYIMVLRDSDRKFEQE